MKTHQIVSHAGAYRIEATTTTGKHWLLARVYPTEAAAKPRLRALQAMAEADHQAKIWAEHHWSHLVSADLAYARVR
jgi:hypothetical protein